MYTVAAVVMGSASLSTEAEERRDWMRKSFPPSLVSVGPESSASIASAIENYESHQRPHRHRQQLATMPTMMRSCVTHKSSYIL